MRISCLLGLFWAGMLGLWGQGDVQRYQLEVKLSSETQRIAGSCLLKLTPTRHLDSWTMYLADSLEVARAYVNGQKVPFQHQNGQVRIQFRTALRRGQAHEIALIYGGPLGVRPDARRQIWQKARDGAPLIRMDAKMLPPESWFPVPAGAAQIDSFRFAVIFDRGFKVLAPGRLKETRPLPGAFTRWEFASPQGMAPEELSLYIGRFRARKEIFARESGFGEIEFILSPSAANSPPAALKQVAQATRVYETYFGTLPTGGEGMVWMQVDPWTLSEEGMRDLGMPRDWPARLAGYWWGQSVQAADSAAGRLLRSLSAYSEGVLIGAWQDFEATRQWALDTSRSDFSPDGACWFTLHTLTDNDYVWWETLQGFHEKYAGRSITGLEIEEYFSWKLDVDCHPLFAQYLGAQQAPVLEYKRERKGKKLLCAYRWSSPIAGFSMPVPWRIDGKVEYLTVTDDWQRVERRKLKPEEFEPDNARMWIRLRPLK